MITFIELPPFPLFPHVGPLAVWGLGLLLFLFGVFCWGHDFFAEKCSLGRRLQMAPLLGSSWLHSLQGCGATARKLFRRKLIELDSIGNESAEITATSDDVVIQNDVDT